jgi:hypothetical protein
MAMGPGKYDAACTAARLATDAEAVVLVVFNGRGGHGFSVQSVSGAMGMESLCRSLEAVVAQIRHDVLANSRDPARS